MGGWVRSREEKSGACAPALSDGRLALDAVATHELGHEESTQHVILFLLVEADFRSSTLGGVGHLGLGIRRSVREQATLGQHAGGDSGAGVAQLRDVGLLGETVDTEIGVGVRARLAVNLLDGVLKYHLLILTRHKIKFYVSKVKGQKRLAEIADSADIFAAQFVRVR